MSLEHGVGAQLHLICIRLASMWISRKFCSLATAFVKQKRDNHLNKILGFLGDGIKFNKTPHLK